MVVIAMFASFDKKAEVGLLHNTQALCTLHYIVYSNHLGSVHP